MKVEINALHIIDLYTFTEAVDIVCPIGSPPREEELALRAIDNTSSALLDYCLIYGPRKLLKSIVETKQNLRDVCELIDIEYDKQDDTDTLIERVIANIVKTDFPYSIQGMGFFSLFQYIQNARREHRINERLEALDCANILEQIIIDISSLFLGEILYQFLDDKERIHVKNVLKSRSIQFGSRISQLRRIDRRIRNGQYSNAMEELQRINGQSSIFETLDPKLLQQISSIRGKYIAHGKYQDNNLIIRKSQEIFDLAEEACIVCMRFMPKVIFPVQCSIDEWGFKYIAYLDEEDLDANGKIRSDCHKLEDGRIQPERCNRYFLIDKPINFHAFKKAYCLHPLNSRILRDPTIVYASELANIWERLL